MSTAKSLTASSIEALNALRLVISLHTMREQAEKDGTYKTYDVAARLARPDLELKLDDKAYGQVFDAAADLAKSLYFRGRIDNPEFKMTRMKRNPSFPALTDSVTLVSAPIDWKCPRMGCGRPLAAIDCDTTGSVCICEMGHENAE
jgi:hypothetical protein